MAPNKFFVQLKEESPCGVADLESSAISATFEGKILEKDSVARTLFKDFDSPVEPIRETSPWREKKSRTNQRTYWYNEVTKESTWKDPHTTSSSTTTTRLDTNPLSNGVDIEPVVTQFTRKYLQGLGLTTECLILCYFYIKWHKSNLTIISLTP